MTIDPHASISNSQDKPNAARMYDYFLGGHHNFAVDRIAAEQAIKTNPDAPLAAQANRTFLRRAVKFLVEQGVDQFLDIGSGIPTAGNVHEVVQQAQPAARVVYVDNDGVAVRYSEALLRDNPTTLVIQADARRPEDIVNHADVRHLLDFSRPIGVLLVAILHFVSDDAGAYRLVRFLRDAVVPGSFLAVSHVTHEPLPPEVSEQMQTLYAKSASPVRLRSCAEIERFFEGLALVEPGLVYVPRWRPEGYRDLWHDQPERSAILAGVGVKC